MLRSRAERRVATALFIDVVGSTRIAADAGDRRWRELVAAFRASVRGHLKRHGGREVDTAGDGFFATFESPASALRAAAGIVAEVQALGLDVRCGLHTGELERIDGRQGGIAAHIGARVMAEAGPARILATGTVRDLVVGGGVDFEPAEEVELKGVPGRWMLQRLTAVDGRPLPAPLPPDEAASRRVVDDRRSGRARLAVVVGGGVLVAFGAFAILQLTREEAAGETPNASPSASASPPIALMKLDPITREFTATVRDPALPPFGGEIQVVDGTLWYAMADTLTRRDLASGAVLATIELPADWWAIKPGFGSLWIGHPRVDPDVLIPPKIDRVNPISGRLIKQIEPDTVIWDFAIGDDAIYLLGEPAEVIELDPVTNEFVDRDPTGTETQPHYIGYEDGRLWLSEADRSSEFDPETDTVVGTVNRGELGLGNGGTDPETGIIWMADRGNRTLTPFDPQTQEPKRTIGLMGVPRGFAFGLDALWLAAEEYVYRIDSWSHLETAIPMPEGVTATGIGIDEETLTIWVSTCAVDCEDFAN